MTERNIERRDKLNGDMAAVCDCVLLVGGYFPTDLIKGF